LSYRRKIAFFKSCNPSPLSSPLRGEKNFLPPLTFILSPKGVGEFSTTPHPCPCPKGRGVELVEVDGEEDLGSGSEAAKVSIA